ncbi:MAG: MFS transporter [Chloroflexota bacterium]|nr:MFS transporter [Chloroflexota bacterium]
MVLDRVRPPLAAETVAQSDIQRKVVGVLAAAQVLGGVGVATAVAVGVLLATELSSEEFAGLASAGSVIGAALIAIPVSRLMDVHGRRPGLLLAYAIGIVGAVVVVIGAINGSFPLALLGLVAAGGGTTATLQSRYAATDLASPDRRGRSLATVVWATTIGSVLGPNLASPMGRFAESIGIPSLAGPYLLTMVVFLLSATLIFVFLRPDPLLAARASQRAAAGVTTATTRVKRSMREALAIIFSTPAALLGFAAIVLGHSVMVGVMSMTPVHLHHADATLEVIGLVISLHIAGMYAASPLVGIAADRFGRRPVIATGCGLLLVAVAVAGTASGHDSTRLAIGLAILGLGWSCTMIGGSTLLTDSVSLYQLPNVQGTADVMMGFAGASAGILAGVVIAFGSYAILSAIAAVMIVPLLLIAVQAAWRHPTRTAVDAAAD